MIAQNKIHILIILILSVYSCKKEKSNSKIIVVHARGISYPEMQKYLSSTETQGFFKHRQSNTSIKKLTAIPNAVTISNIASFETGTYPSEHGIIGHAFGNKEEDTLLFTSGFSKRFEKETFWEKADKNNKKVLNIGSLALHGKYNEHNNVDLISQGTQIGAPGFLYLIPKTKNPSFISYKTVEGSSEIKLSKDSADTFVVYTLNNQPKLELIFDTDYDYTNGYIEKLQRGNWFKIPHKNKAEESRVVHGKWEKSTSDTVKLYVRPTYKNRGYPNAFVNETEQLVGQPKGWPNIPFFTSGVISKTTLVEEIFSETNHVMDIFLKVSKTKPYDLIMIDYPLMDRIGHAFLDQRGSSEHIKQLYKDTFAKMDEDFANIETFAKESGYDLVIASGHGFSPVHTSVDINNLLKAKGIKTDFLKNDWEAIGVPGKVSSHIYLNEQLNSEQRTKVLERIKRLALELHDSKRNQAVVDKVMTKNDLEKIHLQHKNAGDVFIMLNPGYVFANIKDGEIFGRPTFNGDHGYSPKHEESFGILISDLQCEPCFSVNIAKHIEHKLGLKQ